MFGYKVQKHPETVVVWSDANSAGCRGICRSTSGGVIVFGSHCFQTYSSTQDIIALSSGKAEFHGIVRGGSHGLGMAGLCRYFGSKVSLRINPDSSASKSIGSRKGVGKVRRLIFGICGSKNE